jgi:hypothetical protein
VLNKRGEQRQAGEVFSKTHCATNTNVSVAQKKTILK